MQNLSLDRTEDILVRCKGNQIAVLGDIMLDRYFWGSVSRISPEAPVPVIDIDSESYHLGGAANVANNLISLGLKPLLCGLLGNDNTGKTFIEIAENSGIDTGGMFIDPQRPTTVKTRIIGNNQHIARLDRESLEQITSEGENHIISYLNSNKNISGIIFSDYNKGTLSDYLIGEIISFGRINQIPIYVDPKFDNFFSYKKATVIKPNRKEASQALGFTIKNSEDVVKAGRQICERLNCQYVLITLGKDGMMLIESNGNLFSAETQARNVSDVSGAGDTAISALSAAVSGGATMLEAAAIANFASGAVCEQPGIVPITSEALKSAIKRYNMNMII